MNDIRPFRGITPNEAVVGPLGDVVCPPYDIISPPEQESLYARSPYNLVRLELGREEPGDDLRHNRYTRAATMMEEWMAAGALLREDVPALYIYDQQFVIDGRPVTRRGVLASLRLAPWSDGVVLPHEETMAKPKEDRLRLMRATDCNLSPLFLLFQGEGAAAGEMERLARARPDAEADTGDGQIHRLWVVRGEAAGGLLSALRGAQLYMADGHHRYETALAYRDERRAGDANPSEDAAYNFAMVLLVDAGDPGLVVLPTHRLVRGVDADMLRGIETRLGEHFQVENVGVETGGPDQVAQALLERMREAGQSAPAMGLYDRESGARMLRVRQPSAFAPSGSGPLLDVDVLHGAVMEPLLGIGPDQLKAGGQVVYTRDAAEAVLAVEDGDYQAAFLLNPTRVQQVLETARAGGKMPQKSTYFYPKPATGLVINWLKGEMS